MAEISAKEGSGIAGALLPLCSATRTTEASTSSA